MEGSIVTFPFIELGQGQMARRYAVSALVFAAALTALPARAEPPHKAGLVTFYWPPEKLPQLVKDLESSAMPTIANFANASYHLPAGFHVSVNRCSPGKDAANASYMAESEDTGSQGEPNGETLPAGILFCWELAGAVKNSIDGTPYLTAGVREQLFSEAMALALAHTLGHAFSDLFHLPNSSKNEQENFADQVSVYLLVKAGMKKAGINAATAIFVAGTKGEVFKKHAPDKRRLMNMACWSYGANPNQDLSKQYDAVAKQWSDTVGERRKDGCKVEWGMIEGAIDRFLEEHKKHK
jgi:hypothetical protein